MAIRRTGTPVQERGTPRAPETSAKPAASKTSEAHENGKAEAAADVADEGAEARRRSALAEAVGDERRLHVEGAPAADDPMGLRFLALQQAGDLDVDEARAGRALADARSRNRGEGKPDLPLLHPNSRLAGTPGHGNLIDPVERRRELDAAGLSGVVSTVVGPDSSHLSANLGRQGESDLGAHRAEAKGTFNASGAGIIANAAGTADYQHTTDRGAELGLNARSGVHLDHTGVELAAGVTASRRRVREEELEDGGKRTTVDLENATGDALKGTLRGERSRTTRTERPLDGGGVEVRERKAGVRGQSEPRNIEAFASDTLFERRGDEVRARRLEGRAGLLGLDGKVTLEERDQATGKGRRRSAAAAAAAAVGRVSVKGEAATLGREQAPDGSLRDVEQGLAGGLDAHRLGFAADGRATRSDGEGGTTALGGEVVYDPTGLALNGTRSADKADGDGAFAKDGIKLNDDQAGLTFSRTDRERLSDSESRSAATTVDALLGRGRASSSLTRSRSHATVGGDGFIEQKTFFERFGANLEAFRKVTDAGPVASSDPELHGKHGVELHQKVGGGGSAFVGQLSGVVGLYGGLSLQRGKEIRYRTHMEKDRAALAAKNDEDDGLLAQVKHHVVGATFLGETRLALPDLKSPESWRLHDEVELHTTGSFSAKLGATAYAGRASVEVQAAGDFGLRVKKTGAAQVEVEVTPTRMRGVRGSGGAVIFDAGAGRVRAQAFAQRFSFDLDTPGGRDAYDAVLQGRLPGELRGANVDARQQGLDLVNDDDLAAGVSRLRVEKIEVREHERSASAGWLHRGAGRSTHKRNVRHMASDGDVSVNLHTRGLDKRRRTLLSGNEHRGVSGSLRAVTVLDDAGRRVSTFESLTLEASFADDKVKGKELDDEVIARINRSFGLQLEGVEQRGKKETQQVWLSARLTPASLDHLAAADTDLVARVVEERGGNAKAIARLVAEVRQAPDDHAAAALVQEFVAAHGADGMGQVIALAGAELELSSSSSAYHEPLADAATLESRWAERPWDAQGSKKELSARYGALRDTADALEDGAARLEQDPFFQGSEAEREELKGRLEQARAGLAPLTDFSRLPVEDALLIHQKLEHGWTTKTQRRFQKELATEAGLSQLESGWRSAAATAVEQRDDGEVRIRAASERRWLPLFGDEHTQLSASTRLVQDDDGTERVASVRLRAEVYDQKSRLGEADRAAQRVARAFGADVGGFEGAEALGGSTRTLSLERRLDEEDLARLGALDDDSVAAAAKGAPDGKRLRRLARALSDAGGDVARAWALEDHVTEHGLAGMGEVHRLLGGELSVEGSSDAYEQAAASAEDVVRRHPSAVLPTASAKEVVQRFKDARAADEELSKAEDLLERDGLLSPAAREAAHERLADARDALEGVTLVSHLGHEDAAALVASLEGRWTTKDEAAAAEALREGAGLTSVRASAGLVRARSLRQEGRGSLEVTTHEEKDPTGAGERLHVRAARSLEPGAPLLLEARFSDETERDGELGSAVVRRLNEAFGTSYPSRPTPGDGSARTVTVRAELDEATLERLAGRDRRQAARAGLERGLDAAETTALLEGLSRANDHERRAALVQEFVGEHGLAGMGLVHHLVAPGARPELETHSEGWVRAQARADEAILLYGAQPLHGGMTKHELLTTVEAFELAHTELSAARERVSRDPLLSKSEEEALLEEMDARLTALSEGSSFASLSEADRERLGERFGVLDKWRHRGLLGRLKKGA